MRIIQLTPGTGSFHCGACIRDNALVTALRQLGHDAVIVPLYLPMTLDEPNPTPDSPLLFGGINVYLQQRSALFRRTPAWVDNLFNRPKALNAAAHRSSMTSPADLGELTLSTLQGESGNQAKEVEKVLAWLEQGERPDVLCLSNVMLVGMVRRLKEATGAAVVCTLQGEDSFLDSLPEPQRTQCWETLRDRCREVEAFIPPSRYYADLMTRRLSLDPDRVHVVYNGINVSGYEARPALPAPPVLGYLARLCPTKGLDTLVEAFLLLRQTETGRDLRLHAAGTQTPKDAEFVRGLHEQVTAAGAGEAVTFSTNLDRAEKLAYLRSLTVLSVPATYGESFGLYVIESLAAGVPVVQPRHGAFPELLETTGGGQLCEPDDPESLANAIGELLQDDTRNRQLADTGRKAVLERFTAETMARRVAEVLAEAGARASRRTE